VDREKQQLKEGVGLIKGVKAVWQLKTAEKSKTPTVANSHLTHDQVTIDSVSVSKDYLYYLSYLIN
jgi:hypothetical protein